MQNPHRVLARLALVLGVGGGTSGALAQEVINTPSATQPAPGVFTFQSQVRYERLVDREGGFAVRQVVVPVRLTTGLTRDLAVSLTLPLISRSDERGVLAGTGGSPEDASDYGPGDAELLFKYRVYRADTGPLDTTRVVLLAGAELPTGAGDLGSQSFDPIIGVALTSIKERHGFGAAVRAQFNTGSDTRSLTVGQNRADLLRYDLTYAYRLVPERFDVSTSHGSWYGVLELNGASETNGDHELVIAPGILYEGAFGALEFGLRLPAYSDIDHRAELDYGFVFGVRWLF